MALLGPNGEPVATPPTTPTQNLATEEPQPPARVTTAFLIFQMPNGQWVVSEDLGTPIVPSRKPVPDDIISGTENVKAQTIAHKTADMAAKATVMTQLAFARQAQQQQLSPAEAAALAAAQRRS
jgi:hypothetical protein